MEPRKRAPRKAETEKERHERLEREAQSMVDQAAAEDETVAETIRKNIERYGP